MRAWVQIAVFAPMSALVIWIGVDTNDFFLATAGGFTLGASVAGAAYANLVQSSLATARRALEIADEAVENMP